MDCTDGQDQRFAGYQVSWVNARIKYLCGVTKGVDEKIDDDAIRWFDYMERMENDKLRGSV